MVEIGDHFSIFGLKKAGERFGSWFRGRQRWKKKKATPYGTLKTLQLSLFGSIYTAGVIPFTRDSGE